MEDNGASLAGTGPAPYGLSRQEASQAEPLVPSAAQLHILQHSLGLTRGREEYRNHFVTGEGSTDYPGCMALVEAGLMERRGFSALTGGDWCFTVTDAGKAAARAALPKLTRGQERYRKWLDVSDATNETFGEFLKRVTAQGMPREARRRECGSGPSGLASPVAEGHAPGPSTITDTQESGCHEG